MTPNEWIKKGQNSIKLKPRKQTMMMDKGAIRENIGEKSTI